MTHANRASRGPWLVAFDMDGTLLDGRVIYAVGQRLGLLAEIDEIIQKTRIPYVRSRRIAGLLKGAPASDLIKAAESIPFMNGAKDTIARLRNTKRKVGVISDSYTL